MSICTCHPSALTAVSFDRGISLLRCARHEQQAWTIGGEVLERTEALDTLRALFYERRGQRREIADAAVATAPAAAAPATPPATPVRRPAAPDDVIHLSGREADESLTALLRAHGISGAWAIA